MKKISFFVPDAPVAKGRPRSRIVQPKGKKAFVSIYTPSGTEKYERRVKEIAEPFFPWPLTGAIGLRIVFVHETPKSWSGPKTRRAYGKLKLTKPDLDNLAKSIGDALNKLAYADDGQICRMEVVKRYMKGPDEAVGAYVTILELEDGAHEH